MTAVAERSSAFRAADRQGKAWSAATSIWPVTPDLVGCGFGVFGTFGALLVTRQSALAQARRVLARELDAIDRACSRFRADSELTALNQAGGAQRAVSPLFAAALAVALRAAEATDGDVDPTCGRSLVSLGYDRDFAELAGCEQVPLPPPAPAAGWRCVQLDQAARTVRLPAGVELDLGATAKALAADRAATAVATATGAGVLVNLGGDIAVAGQPPDCGWRVQIADDLPRLSVPGGGAVRRAGR